MEVLAQNLPAELLQGKCFVNWSWVWQSKNGKPPKWDKPPKNPSTGYPASSTAAETWGNFAQAYRLYEDGKVDGIGRVIQPPYIGIDLDDCRDPETGIIDEWALRIIRALNTYTEISPSGKGVKLWLKGKLPGAKHHKKVGGVEIEIYDKKRYFTLTGHLLDGLPQQVEKRQAELDALYKEIFGEEPEADRQPPKPTAEATLGDAEILRKVRGARNAAKFERLWSADTSGYKTHSEADYALLNTDFRARLTVIAI